MRTVAEIIAELKSIADNPVKAMEDYKKEKLITRFFGKVLRLFAPLM